MAQGPHNQQGPQKCFLVAPEEANQSRNPVIHRQLARVPANTRLQVVRAQPSDTAQKPVPVRVAIAKPITAQQPRLKHTAVAPVPTEDVKRRKIVKQFDEIWPTWSLPLGIRSPYSPATTRLLGAMLRGEIVGRKVESIDLVLPISAWRTQGDDYSACFATCLLMIGKTNKQVPPDIGPYVSIVRESGINLVKQSGYQQGIETINSFLRQKKPIIVGVNRDFKKTPNRDRTTDHFVVIVASGVHNGRFYYRFFDPGTKHIQKGASADNRLYLDEKSGLFVGQSAYNAAQGVEYTLCWVRASKN